MSIQTIRSGVLNHPESTVLQSLTDMVRASGVVNPSTDLLVKEAAGGGLNVDVDPGNCYIKGVNTNAYPIRSTVIETLAIGANTSGNPRIDAVVIYVDLNETPDPSGGGDDVAEMKVVAGIPASSPVAPDASAIQASVGAGNPYLVLANVLVANGASGVSESNISNLKKRVNIQTFSPIYEEAFDATWEPNYLNSNKQKMTLTNNVVMSAPINMEIGDLIQLEFIQDATGGRSVTWFSGITWLSADYTINTGMNRTTVYILEKTGNSTYKGYLAGKQYT
jgi:hypothetical protein